MKGEDLGEDLKVGQSGCNAVTNPCQKRAYITISNLADIDMFLDISTKKQHLDQT